MNTVSLKCASVLGRASLVFLFLCLSPADQRAISSIHGKLFHDLVTGKGLYASSDHVTVLDSSNFNTSVIQNQNQAWVVEFYNSWCGHCIRYSSTWKSFAQNIYNWKDVLTVGVVDCSLSINSQLCRDYEVMAYPSLRYFPPSSPSGFYGDDLQRKLSVEDLRHLVIEAIEKSVFENKGAASWPNLKVTENLTEALSVLASEIKYVAIMFDRSESFAGTELILDFHNVKELKVLRILDTNEEYTAKFDVKDLPSLYIQQRDSSNLTLLPVKNTTREDFFNATKLFLNKQGIEVKNLVNFNETNEVVDPDQIYDIFSEEKTLGDDKVYQLDLEMALRHTLFHELKTRKVFDGETLDALKKFVRVMARYFPLSPAGKELLQQFDNDVWNHWGPLTIEQYNQYIQPFESRANNYLLNPGGYMNCAQSIGKPPCSLWLLYHTLIVQAHAKHLERTQTSQGQAEHLELTLTRKGHAEHIEHKETGQGQAEHLNRAQTGQGHAEHLEHTETGQSQAEHLDRAQTGQGHAEHLEHTETGQGQAEHLDRAQTGQGHAEHLEHTETGQGHAKGWKYSDPDPQEVLNSIYGYVKYFFGCTDCSKHFQSMYVSIPSYDNSFDSRILWLWKAHNQVNARLSNDSIPGRLKIQFPSAVNCPKCRHGNEWNEGEVLNHLKSVYTKISLEPLPKSKDA